MTRLEIIKLEVNEANTERFTNKLEIVKETEEKVRRNARSRKKKTRQRNASEKGKQIQEAKIYAPHNSQLHNIDDRYVNHWSVSACQAKKVGEKTKKLRLRGPLSNTTSK